VKFGGHPTDPANKIVLPIKEHRMVNTPPPERRWLRVTA
jgi:hypothetical protein